MKRQGCMLVPLSPSLQVNSAGCAEYTRGTTPPRSSADGFHRQFAEPGHPGQPAGDSSCGNADSLSSHRPPGLRGSRCSERNAGTSTRRYQALGRPPGRTPAGHSVRPPRVRRAGPPRPPDTRQQRVARTCKCSNYLVLANYLARIVHAKWHRFRTSVRAHPELLTRIPRSGSFVQE